MSSLGYRITLFIMLISGTGLMLGCDSVRAEGQPIRSKNQYTIKVNQKQRKVALLRQRSELPSQHLYHKASQKEPPKPVTIAKGEFLARIPDPNTVVQKKLLPKWRRSLGDQLNQWRTRSWRQLNNEAPVSSTSLRANRIARPNRKTIGKKICLGNDAGVTINCPSS